MQISRLSGLVVASLALLALAGAAEAIIIYDFPIFGLVNGAQTARINAVLSQPPEPDAPCPVTLTFIDAQGNQIETRASSSSVLAPRYSRTSSETRISASASAWRSARK